jgi:hypothetical protein
MGFESARRAHASRSEVAQVIRTAMRRLALFLLVGAVPVLGGAGTHAQQYSLVGNWQGAASLGGLPVTSNATLRADGSFSMLAESEPGLSFNVVGVYTVIPAQQTIRFVNREWSPREQCMPGMDFQIHCTALAVPPTLDVQYRFGSADLVVVQSPSLTIGPVQYQRVR